MRVIDFATYYQPKAKQAAAHASKAKYILFGGAMGGGKSWWLVAEAIRNAMRYPGNRLVIIRKELSVMRRTILVTFFSVCPRELIRSYNQTTSEVTFINGSVLYFMEANQAKDPLLQKLKGLEIGFFGIDEANEVSEEVYRILKTRQRWVLPDGSKPRYVGRLTSNPEQCWLVPTFIQSSNLDEVYIQSLTTDNYEESDAYVLQLKEAFKDNPNLMAKYLLGDWSTMEGINQLIPSLGMEACRRPLQSGYGNSLGVDVARYGDDRTAFCVMVDGNVARVESYQKTSTQDVVTRTIALMKEFAIPAGAVGIDSVGLGAGVVDSLRSLDYNVVEIVGGEKPVEILQEEAFRPHNLRAQLYLELRRDIMAGNIGNLEDQRLRHELANVRYEITSDRTLKVVSKDIIKRLLGRSPDLADSLAYANWVKQIRGGETCFYPVYGG